MNKFEDITISRPCMYNGIYVGDIITSYYLFTVNVSPNILLFLEHNPYKIFGQ